MIKSTSNFKFFCIFNFSVFATLSFSLESSLMFRFTSFNVSYGFPIRFVMIFKTISIIRNIFVLVLFENSNIIIFTSNFELVKT